jgi:hypothetical protein
MISFIPIGTSTNVANQIRDRGFILIYRAAERCAMSRGVLLTPSAPSRC